MSRPTPGEPSLGRYKMGPRLRVSDAFFFFFGGGVFRICDGFLQGLVGLQVRAQTCLKLRNKRSSVDPVVWV